MEYVTFILPLVVMMGLGCRCMLPPPYKYTNLQQSKLNQTDDRTYPPQKLCKNRSALLLWKASPMMDWSVTKVTKMRPPYPENLPLQKNICSVHTFVDGCQTIRYVVTDFHHTFFTVQNFAARYINGSLLNISVMNRTFVLMDENYQIYSAHTDKMTYAKPDGTLEDETEIPKILNEYNGQSILVARVAENKDKWAIFQMCNQDVAWVAVSTEKARENPRDFLRHYEAEIEMTLRELKIDTSTMVDIEAIMLPFEPVNRLPPYRAKSSNKSGVVAEAPKKTKGSKRPRRCPLPVNRFVKDQIRKLRSLISKIIPPSKRNKVVHCKNAASSSGPKNATTSRRIHRSESYSDSDTSNKPKRKLKHFRVMRVPRRSIDLSIPEASQHYARGINDYTNYVDIRLFVGSWNVNGQPPVDMSDWLGCDEDPPDIYAIGFQELDRSKEALLFHNSPREEEWLNAVARSLPTSKYRKVALVRLVGMMLVVFTKSKFVPHVRGIDLDTAGTGILGKLGNKGGVAARFELFNTSVCFVNVHLAAHVEGNDKRNQNYRDILSRISFRKVVPPRTIPDHDQVYWFGDLNYRIIDLPTTTIKEMIDDKHYDSLMKYDQLFLNQAVGGAFEDYEEGRIMFRPTYKYDVGTTNWDSSKKGRTPSWCDRIVWKGKDIEQLSYRSHLSFMISDHKPVSALFATKFHIIDNERYQYFKDRVTRQLDTWDAKTAPKIMVSPLEVNFGDVHFIDRQTKILTIINKGHVKVLFEFKKKPNESRYCKDWLRIETYAGSIRPGEKCEINLKVYVDKRMAHELNSGEDTINDVLGLHFEPGGDIDVRITGTYKHSCFGSSLDVLSLLRTRPINQVSSEELISLEKQRVYEWSNMSIIPVMITALVEHLYQYGMREQRLFEQPGLYWELLQIRDWLDSGAFEHIPDVTIHSVAEALLLLLDSTPEPLIPYVLHKRCLSVDDEGHDCGECKQIIASLSQLNKSVFLYLCTFLQDLLLHTDDNKLDPDTTVTLFGEIFLRRPPQSEAETSEIENKSHERMLDRKRSKFMVHILINLNNLI